MNAFLVRPAVVGRTAWTAATSASCSASIVTTLSVSRRLPAAVQRSFSMLPYLRPSTTPSSAVFRPALAPSPLSLATTLSTPQTASSSADLISPASISRHPALGGIAGLLRCGPRPTMERTSRLIQKRRAGFLARLRTKTGRRTLVRRRLKGRRRLTY